MRSNALLLAAAAGSLLWVGCSGTIEDGFGGAGSGAPQIGAPNLAAPVAGSGAQSTLAIGDLPFTAPAPVPAPLRARTWKLSHAQYAKAIAAFVGAKDTDVSALESEIDNGVYPNMSASGLVRATLARDYYDNAERISAGLSAQQLAGLTGGRTLDASAKSTFLETAIRRAFRRPATSEDISAFGEIFDLGAGAATDASAPFRAVIRALLTSPFFLYRTEIGSDPSAGTFALTDYEIASLLSFSLQDAPPSDALLQAAARGELSNPTTLAGHVNAQLATPEAATMLRTFLTQWLKIHDFDELDKDTAVFPTFEAVRSAMATEANDFLTQKGGMLGTLAGLLTSPLAPKGALATFYASEPSSAGAMGTRTGALGLGAVLASRAKPNSTSPTLRGLFVRDRFLCQEIHLPPNLPPDIVETQRRSMPRTTRELYELHAQNPSCAACHSMLDSIGFNFEDLDAAGRFRVRENSVAVDTRGELTNADVSGVTLNHTELANRLANSEWVRECMARQVFRFYFGQVEVDRGVPAIQAARQAPTFREMVVAMMSSSSALQRVRQ